MIAIAKALVVTIVVKVTFGEFQWILDFPSLSSPRSSKSSSFYHLMWIQQPLMDLGLISVLKHQLIWGPLVDLR